MWLKLAAPAAAPTTSRMMIRAPLLDPLRQSSLPRASARYGPQLLDGHPRCAGH